MYVRCFYPFKRMEAFNALLYEDVIGHEYDYTFHSHKSDKQFLNKKDIERATGYKYCYNKKICVNRIIMRCTQNNRKNLDAAPYSII